MTNTESLLTEEIFNNFLVVQERIHQKAEELLKEINDIKKIDGYSYLYVKSIDSSSIDFYGEEYYCGSTDSYEFSIPTHLLYDDSARTQYMQRIKEEENERLRKIQENKIKEREILENREKELLEKLKNKYESNQ